ncbi:uncharacterized protein NEMAJ01_0918 [Nematocida major]|uniref:uncharacterized protein n=1 Tax=Nematocida major TaxID=1912982 RepID=UPI00200841CF|nr:uncharacterized protein NEMAJ01_0918 [Nematocida major]KAH9386022.1 hypothetical protein NEMAJ01_0918 [Nematocida major]
MLMSSRFCRQEPDAANKSKVKKPPVLVEMALCKGSNAPQIYNRINSMLGKRPFHRLLHLSEFQSSLGLAIEKSHDASDLPNFIPSVCFESQPLQALFLYKNIGPEIVQTKMEFAFLKKEDGVYVHAWVRYFQRTARCYMLSRENTLQVLVLLQEPEVYAHLMCHTCFEAALLALEAYYINMYKMAELPAPVQSDYFFIADYKQAIDQHVRIQALAQVPSTEPSKRATFLAFEKGLNALTLEKFPITEETNLDDYVEEIKSFEKTWAWGAYNHQRNQRRKPSCCQP